VEELSEPPLGINSVIYHRLSLWFIKGLYLTVSGSTASPVLSMSLQIIEIFSGKGRQTSPDSAVKAKLSSCQDTSLSCSR